MPYPHGVHYIWPPVTLQSRHSAHYLSPGISSTLCPHFTPGLKLSSSQSQERRLKMIEWWPHTSAPQSVTSRLGILVAAPRLPASCHLESVLDEASGCKGHSEDTGKKKKSPGTTIRIQELRGTRLTELITSPLTDAVYCDSNHKK